MKTWTMAEMKPGLIVGYPQMRNTGGTWRFHEVPTGKTLRVIVMEVTPRFYDSNNLDIRGYALTKDGKISHSGWNNYGDNLQRFENIDQIIGPADEQLVREARGLMLPEWVRKADPKVRERAIGDAEFLARVRAAQWKPDVQRVLIAEATGVSVEDVALTERAKYIVDWRYGAGHVLFEIGLGADVMIQKASEFGVDEQLKEAFALIAQTKSILDALTVETLLANHEKVKP